MTYLPEWLIHVLAFLIIAADVLALIAADIHGQRKPKKPEKPKVEIGVFHPIVKHYGLPLE